LLLAAAAELSTRAPAADPFEAGPWRHFGAARLRYRGADGDEHEVRARREGGSSWRIEVGGETSIVEVLSSGGDLRAEIDGRYVEAGYATDGGGVLVSVGGEAYRLEKPGPPDVDAAGAEADAGAASLVAPMPGTVVKVMVGEGDEVEEGQPLLVLEAMKMEQTVAAPYSGTVTSLPFAEGALVPGGSVLAEVSEQRETEE
jgi:3-methylcrotonyl-CoA carboxylase alpha subunit